MVAWIVIGWIACAVGLAALHHRLRSRRSAPPGESLLLDFARELAANHPEAEFRGVLPQRFSCILVVDGQETIVPLHDLHHAREAGPNAFRAAVRELVGRVRRDHLDRIEHHDFGRVAVHVLPHLRPARWVAGLAASGAVRLVHRLLTRELAVTYAIEREHDVVFVTEAHLARWGRSEADLWNLARTNLAQRSPELLAQLGGLQGALVCSREDGLDASRALLLLDRAEGMLVAVPDRDTLWVAPASCAGIGHVRNQLATLMQASEYPLSAAVHRVHEGALVPLGAEPSAVSGRSRHALHLVREP